LSDQLFQSLVAALGRLGEQREAARDLQQRLFNGQDQVAVHGEPGFHACREGSATVSPESCLLLPRAVLHQVKESALTLASFTANGVYNALVSTMCIQKNKKMKRPAGRSNGVLRLCRSRKTYTVYPYKRWGSVAGLTYHLQGSTPYWIRFPRKTYRPLPTKDVT
jgi:hypothetical protein